MLDIIDTKTKKRICSCGVKTISKDTDSKVIHTGDEVYLEVRNKAVGFFPVVVEGEQIKLYGSKYTLGKSSNLKLGSIVKITRSYNECKAGDQIYKNLVLEHPTSKKKK